MAKIISYQRDRFVETSELAFPFIDDIGGTIRGYRVFTACRTVNGKIFRMEDHLDRLYNSATGVFMQPPLDRNGLRQLLQALVERNRQEYGAGDLLIEVVFSGGLDGSTMKQSGRGAHLYVATQELVEPEPECYEKGVALASFPHLRMWADVKLLNYVGAVIAHQTVVPARSAYDVLYVDPKDGRTVLEGSTFTVFFVDKAGDIVTPPLDGRILDSITRRVIFQLVGSTPNLRLIERVVCLNDLSSLPEAFIASTTRAVLPVTRIDETVIGDGKPGPVTRRLMGVFSRYLEAY